MKAVTTLTSLCEAVRERLLPDLAWGWAWRGESSVGPRRDRHGQAAWGRAVERAESSLSEKENSWGPSLCLSSSVLHPLYLLSL